MDSNDLEVLLNVYFWFHSEVTFLTRFDVFLDLIIFAYFNATFIYFYAVKSFNANSTQGRIQGGAKIGQ